MTSPRTAAIAVALACSALSRAVAQGTSAAAPPWRVQITTAPSPIIIGNCAPVSLAIVDPATKDIPRDPTGLRVSLKEFDLTVTAAQSGAVAGQYKGANYFAVCACQTAAVGTVATITASYPAGALAAKLRIPGIDFQTTQTVSLAAARGTFDPPECQAAKVMAASGSTPTLMIAPLGMAIPGGSAPSSAVAPPRGGAVAVAPPRTAPPGVLPGAMSAPTRNTPGWFGFGPVAPLVNNMAWYTVPSATRYAVFRSDGTGPSVDIIPANFKGGVLSDTVPDPRPTYRYTLVAYFADGTSIAAPPEDFISPAPTNPSGFMATDNGTGRVDFKWNAANDAASYRLDGPGLPSTGMVVSAAANSAQVSNIPPGGATWRLVALYARNTADYPNASTVSLRVLATHQVPWLSKNNGAGTVAQTIAHYMPRVANGALFNESDLFTLADVVTFRSWMNSTPRPGAPQGQWSAEAVYGNAGDLGVGRRTDCFQEMKSAPVAGLRTVCYAAAHGIPPGQPGFNDPAVITNPGVGQSAGFILAMMIIKDPLGTQFLVFNAKGNSATTLASTATLDTEGPKLVPHTCISCHGGRYNGATARVDGAHFLPLDPQLLAFASPLAQSQQEEKIRKLNVMMMNADPTSAVAIYIRGLYQGAHLQAGKVAKPDFIPSGWSQQTGLYRQVVRPYCVMCHLAGPSNLDFSNYGNFQSSLGMMFAAVCKAHTMPHSQLQFQSFWTKPTGAINIPGLLAVTTGNPSCS